MNRDYEAEALTLAWSNWIARRQAQIAASSSEQDPTVPRGPEPRPLAAGPARKSARRSPGRRAG